MPPETASDQLPGDFAALVRKIRVSRGLTQEGLARELGVSFATINGWENGRHRPLPALARRLAEMAEQPSRLPGEPGTAGAPGAQEPGPAASGAPAGPAASGSQDPAVADADARAATSGWPPDARERRDFYHRPREFPPEVARWRAAMVQRVRQEPQRFPLVARAVRAAMNAVRAASDAGADADAIEQAAVEATRGLVDEGISYLREVARVLAVLYGTPRLGNKADPVDELVYIILSRKTREDAYQRAYDALKRRFPVWDALLDATPDEVEGLLASSGLGEKKTTSLFGALGALRARFGSCTLEPARGWTDEQLESFLCSLPELHRKSAYCIMMYAFGRQVFPVDAHVGRVLSRLRPYRELGLDLDDLDHKQLQVVLADLVPPNLRYSLHVNLISHGRDVCRAQKPLCSECEIRGLCGFFRRAEAARVQDLEQPRIVDLFCGAGGLSEGFERAGFTVALAVDLDPVAMRTHWLNHPAVPDDRVVCRDIRSFAQGELRRLAGRRVDVLVGAPPCQGFSHVGHRSKQTLTGYTVTGDERNFLYKEMVGAALELRPRLFLMENVPGMKSARKGEHSFLDEAARDLEGAGFRTAMWKLNAASFGVPQDRIRYFLVAARDLPLPARPVGPYQDLHARDFDTDALPSVTFEDATFDLPPRGADEGPVIDLWPRRADLTTARYRRYLAKFGLLSPSRMLFNHTVRYHNERDLELYALLSPGEDSVHALERHGRADLMRYRADVFDDKYARLRADRPCKTIVAHLAKDGNGYIHPTQVRSISFREAARVQSFRDDYIFCGSPSDQWVHLGNAVPPIMAEAIARSFRAALGARK